MSYSDYLKGIRTPETRAANNEYHRAYRAKVRKRMDELRAVNRLVLSAKKDTARIYMPGEGFKDITLPKGR